MNLILDTHLLVGAARASESRKRQGGELERSDEVALELVVLIERVCSKIVLPKALEKQVIHLFRKRGYRFPAQQVGLLQELAEHPKEKLLRTKASAIKRLTQEEAKLLKGRGHRDIQDDRELIEAARAVGANIITRDPWILKTRPELKKELNVGVYWPDQVHG